MNCNKYGGNVSEYFTLTVEQTPDPNVRELVTNQTLTEAEEEVYTTVAAGELGSPIAQTLFHAVDGIRALTLVDDTLIVTPQPGVIWEILIDDIRDALRDFFL
jgi:hypothetical protein